MRVDKFLWCVRVFKTRSIATDACKGGLVKLNNADTKPSKELKIGDSLTVTKGQMTLQLEVKTFPKSRVGAKLVEDHLINNTPEEEYEKMRRMRESAQFVRDRGAGRPTKKERRDLDKWGMWD